MINLELRILASQVTCSELSRSNRGNKLRIGVPTTWLFDRSISAHKKPPTQKKTWTSIIPFSSVWSWWCNIRPSLRCPCNIDWQFSRPERLLFPSGASRSIGNVRTHRMRVETICVGLPGRHSLSPRVSTFRAPVLFGPTTSKRLLRRLLDCKTVSILRNRIWQKTDCFKV